MAKDFICLTCSHHHFLRNTPIARPNRFESLYSFLASEYAKERQVILIRCEIRNSLNDPQRTVREII